MYFYQTLKPIHAITLDLDNTLYNNHLVINSAEIKLISFLQKYHPALSKIQNKDYYFMRQIVKDTNPGIYHNVNNLRWRSLEMILMNAGLSKNEAQSGADRAMDIIIYWRNIIRIPENTHKILEALSARWPLIAITNGNVNLTLCGLKQYFNDILRAGVNGRSKPHTDMYHLASKRLGLSSKYILHIGDDLYTDIQGAILSGMQSCWITQYTTINSSHTKLVPHIKIKELLSLTNLL